MTLDGGFTGTFGITNQTGTVRDGSGSMVAYYWPTSYAAANINLFGQAVPSGPVNVTGIVDVFTGPQPEFIPISITPVPEPGSLVLLGAGFAAAAMMFLRRKTSK